MNSQEAFVELCNLSAKVKPGHRGAWLACVAFMLKGLKGCLSHEEWRDFNSCEDELEEKFPGVAKLLATMNSNAPRA